MLNSALEDFGFGGYKVYNNNFSYSHQLPPEVMHEYSTEEQKIAFIKNLYISGLLTKEHVWESINIMGGFEDNKLVFQEICLQLDIAGAFQHNISQFNPKYLLGNLFSARLFDQRDVQDFILYWTQTAFNRQLHQERISINTQDWMNNEFNKKLYVENARIMGWMEAKIPLYDSYDETWLLGSSALLIEWSMQNLKSTKEKGVNTGFERFLVGDRELVDMGPFESQNTIKKVAEYIGVKYIESQPFKKEKGFTVLNYSESEGRIDERDLAKYLYAQCFQQSLPEENIIYSTSTSEKTRPDTKDTIRDALDQLLERITKGDFIDTKELKILITAPQPFIGRQAKAAQTIINQKLNETGLDHKIAVSVHELAPKLAENIALSNIGILHSDMAAFMAEHYLSLLQHPKRELNHLMFQERQQLINAIDFPSIPETISLDDLSRSQEPEELCAPHVERDIY